MMLLRANTLARGASGCRPLLVDTLLTMLERGVTPRVPSQGSCGSSGDLAPLAHLGMVLARDIADGEARFGGELLPAPEAMARAGIERIELFGKDGLALTNGAQLTTAIGALACYDADRLIQAAEVAAAMSIEALKGATRAFHPAVHALRPHPGAQDTAANLRTLLCGSALVDSVPGKVQDAYSLRCTPQVLGACRDAAAYAQRVVEIELNAVTDNPLILLSAGVTDEGFADDPLNRAYSAGHFHGEPVGIALDVLKIALCEVGSLSERRLYRLTTGNLSQRLPPALVRADRRAEARALRCGRPTPKRRRRRWPSRAARRPERTRRPTGVGCSGRADGSARPSPRPTAPPCRPRSRSRPARRPERTPRR